MLPEGRMVISDAPLPFFRIWASDPSRGLCGGLEFDGRLLSALSAMMRCKPFRLSQCDSSRAERP
jgi:hypothetical protein